MRLSTLGLALAAIAFCGISSFGRDCEPEVRRAIIPKFSAVALALRESGEVRVSVTVDPKGAVISASALSGGTQLRKVSALIAKGWLFSKLDRRDAKRCAIRSMVIVFDYVLLPTDTPSSNDALSYFSFPNKVVVQYIKPEIIVSPNEDPRMLKNE